MTQNTGKDLRAFDSDRDAMKPSMISMRNVNKSFGDFQALKDINLEIPKGQMVIVLGSSGSGKSTLCRTINRLETVEEGEFSSMVCACLNKERH